MSPAQGRHEIVAGPTLTFSSPVELTPSSVQGIDSDVAEWHGDDLLVRIDAGLFADPLTRYGKQPGYEAFEATIDGQRARGVSFVQPDGARFTAVHFPELTLGAGPRKLTLVVISSGRRSPEEAQRIVRSIRFREVSRRAR